MSSDEAREARAVLRYAHISPQKARLVMDLIRGRAAGEALAILRFTPKRAARTIEKVLRSAVSNAGHREIGDPDDLRVVRAYVDVGPTQKRFQARAMGRANQIKRRASHITVVLAAPATRSQGASGPATKYGSSGKDAK